MFEMHFYYLLVGRHPAGGDYAVCLRKGCIGNNQGSIYCHHFFLCDVHAHNRDFFCGWARRLYRESTACETYRVPLQVLENILAKPSPMWFGLMDDTIFALGLKIGVLHELYRILVMASVVSWSRFYSVPNTVT